MDATKAELGAPSRFQNGFAPTKMCAAASLGPPFTHRGTFMAYQGTCDRGDACTFAHSQSELKGAQLAEGGSTLAPRKGSRWPCRGLAGPRKFENNFRPAILCRMWVQHPSYCKEGDACTFAHGPLP